MGTVDACDIHACPGKIQNEVGPIGRLGRKCHHDAGSTGICPSTEQEFGRGFQTLLACEKLGLATQSALAATRAGQRRQRLQHGIDRWQDAAFEAPHGGQAKCHQPALHGPEVHVSERQVMAKVLDGRISVIAIQPQVASRSAASDRTRTRIS